jgi:4-amino-4-deoxy-L-arabinose transferase-like glycosyltransferase
MNTSVPASSQRHSPRALVALLLLFALALAVRLPSLDTPPVDVHHVRQADTAGIARNMLREGIDVFHPRIDWAGADAGYVESELPLYGAAVAALWRALGQTYLPDHRIPRILAICFWLLGGMVLLAFVRRRLRGPPWAYLLLYAFSPLAVVFSRNIQPDSLAVLLMLVAIERADRSSEGEGLGPWAAALLAGLAAGLAIAVKGTLALLLPLLPAILLARRRPGTRRRAVLAALPALAIPTLWYWHAHQTLGADGASFGVWGTTAHKWGAPSLWFSVASWRAIVGSAVAQTLTPLGVLLLIRGAVVARRQAELRMFVVAVLLTCVGFVLLTEGFVLHNYYQLSLVPFASVLCGAALVDAGGRLGQWGALSGRIRLAIAVSVILVAILSVQMGAGFIGQSLRRDQRVEELSRGVSAMLPRKHSVVVADRHPQTVMYAIDRRGWHRTALSPRELRKLQGLGAEYLLLTSSVAEFRDPLMLAYLRLGAIREASGPGWVLYKLRAAPPLPVKAPREVPKEPAP